MDYIEMVEKVREELLQEMNRRCDALIRNYQEEEQGISSRPENQKRILAWVSPATLKGKKPVSLTFGSGETIATPTWKKVVQTILKHCNEQPDMHERLMQLRGKVFGRQRTILGKVPEEMDVPLQMQYGSSLIYPPLVMGCHISEIPNHQTGRQESLRTRTAVASLGNLGLELNLSQISEEEKRQIKEEVAFYKKVRPVVQFGMLYRLKGLQSGNEFAWMHISEDEKQILVTYVQILASPNTVSKRLRLTGLCPDAGYQEAGEMHMYTGRELMSIGLSPGKIRTDAYSRQWLFKRVEESRLLLDD